MNNVPTPRNMNEARRMANSYTRALAMAKEGYTWSDENGMVAICKPGECHAAYWIGEHVDGTNGCDCPDYVKHGSFCKHTLFVEIEKEKLAKEEEEEMFEEMCREYDARAKYEW